MIIAKVIGNVVATAMEPGYEARKVMVVQPVNPEGSPKGKSFLAVDAIQSGEGDLVLVMEEGGSARLVLNEPDTFTVKSVIVGIVDNISFKSENI